MNRRVVIVLLALLALAALRAGYHQRFAARDPLAEAPFGDSLVYLDEVERQFREGEPAAFYKHPLYTALLFVLDARGPAGAARVRDLQWLLGLATLWLTFVLAAARAGTPAGLLAMLLLALYQPLLFEESKLLDSTLGVFTLLLAVVAFDRWQAASARGTVAVCVGVLFGLAALARSPALLVLIALLPFAWHRGGWRAVVLLLCGAALPIAPVTLHNLRASGSLVLVNASDAYTFLAGNNPNAVGIYSLPPGYPDGVLQERAAERDLARQALGHEPTLTEQRAHTFGVAWRHLAASPRRTLTLLADKLRFAWSGHEVDDNYSLRRERERFGLWRGPGVSFPWLLALALIGLLLDARPRLPLIAPLAVTLLVLLLFYVTSRFRLPAVPFLAAAAGIALARLADRAIATRRKLLAVGVALALLLAIRLVGLPVPRGELARSEQVFSQVLDVHAARTLLGQARRTQAAAILAAAIEASPDAALLIGEFRQLLDAAPLAERAAVVAAARAASAGGPRVAALLE